MYKQVVFIGGLHGAGKTSLIAELSHKYGYVSEKQRRVVIEVGRSYGFQTWEEIGPKHNQFIFTAAQRAAQKLLGSKASVMLIDCHYAIRSAKALRVSGRAVASPYIHDLDPIFVLRMSLDFGLKFVLLLAEPEQIIGRFENRPDDLLDYDNTLPGLQEQEVQEEKLLLRLKKIFRIPPRDVLSLVNNDSQFQTSVKILQEFVELPQAPKATGYPA